MNEKGIRLSRSPYFLMLERMSRPARKYSTSSLRALIWKLLLGDSTRGYMLLPLGCNRRFVALRVPALLQFT